MSYREQLTSCPRCGIVITVDSVAINECAWLRIVGTCQNPKCGASQIAREIDPLQIAAAESLFLLNTIELEHFRLGAQRYGH